MSADRAQSSGPTADAIFSLFTLGCSSCSAIIEGRLKKLSGIKDVTVNYVTDTVRVSYDPAQLTTDDIRGFLKNLGYDTTEAPLGGRR